MTTITRTDPRAPAPRRLAQQLAPATLAGAMLLAGCASSSPFERWTSIESPPIDEAQVRRLAATTQPAPSGEAVELPADAGPEDYVRLALARAPSLRAAEQRVQRLLARVPQAEALPDPMLEVAPIGEMAETAAGEVGLMTGISQRFVWPGKLEARGRVAAQEAAVAAAELERLRLELAGNVRRAYWQLYAAVRAIETTRESRALLAQVRDAVRARLEAGQAQQADVLRADVELAEIDRRLTQLNEQRGTMAAMLNRWLDRLMTAPVPDPPAVEPEAVEVERDRLLALAVERHPSLQAVREQLESFRQQLRLARLERVPDLGVSLNYNAVEDEGLAMSATGDDQWWLGFGVNLPIWLQKYEAAEREARHGILESLATLSDQQQQLRFAVESALLEVVSRREQVELFRQQILPQARQALESTQASYRGGRAGFLDLLEAWQRLLALELMYETTLGELGAAVADLREAVGGELTVPEVQP